MFLTLLLQAFLRMAPVLVSLTLNGKKQLLFVKSIAHLTSTVMEQIKTQLPASAIQTMSGTPQAACVF